MPFRVRTLPLALLVFAIPDVAAQSVGLVSPSQVVTEEGALLPRAFSGWQKAVDSQKGADPAQADATKTALFTEAGLVGFEKARYSRQGRKIEVSAYRFADGTGAHAAYSDLYADSAPMAKEKFCQRSGSSGNRILMACTNLVVDVRYDKITAMTPAEMRALAAQLPLAAGTSALGASTPLYLPKDGRLAEMRFALGPAGLRHTGSPLPAGLIDFTKGAEVVVGHYGSTEGLAVLTLVKYPTFALATDRQKAFDDFGKASSTPTSSTSTNVANVRPHTFVTRRIGPIVAVVTGDVPEPEARALAEQVPYDVEVTLNEPTYTPKDNIGNLVVNIIYLAFIMIGFALVMGVAFGGIRLMARRFFPGRFVDRPEDVEFIKLDLRE